MQTQPSNVNTRVGSSNALGKSGKVVVWGVSEAVREEAHLLNNYYKFRADVLRRRATCAYTISEGVIILCRTRGFLLYISVSGCPKFATARPG